MIQHIPSGQLHAAARSCPEGMLGDEHYKLALALREQEEIPGDMVLELIDLEPEDETNACS
jgi:hypothetical protein